MHARISQRRRGGEVEDYLAIHDFIDQTKELCSDNRHRILHTMWGIKRVVVPVFGRTFENSAGKIVNVKDLCEQDHILPDYQNRFIPTLADFVASIPDSAIDGIDFEAFANRYASNNDLTDLLLSPLANTGKKKSLLVTHNAWFINQIAPKVLGTKLEIRDFEISPSDLFDQMRFDLWMDNGQAVPPSAVQTAGKVVG